MISGERPIDVCSSTLPTRAIFVLAAGFWLCVTVSDTLYAEGMRIDIAMYTNYPVFASWSHRALQHLLTFPLLFGCYWISIRIGWSPAWRRVPVQVAMALVVGVLPYWLMQVPVRCGILLQRHPDHRTDRPAGQSRPGRISRDYDRNHLELRIWAGARDRCSAKCEGISRTSARKTPWTRASKDALMN